MGPVKAWALRCDLRVFSVLSVESGADETSQYWRIIDSFSRPAPLVPGIGFRVKGTIPFAQAFLGLLFRNAHRPPRGEIPHSPYSASVLPYSQHRDHHPYVTPFGLRCAIGNGHVTDPRFDGEFADEHRDHV